MPFFLIGPIVSAGEAIAGTIAAVGVEGVVTGTDPIGDSYRAVVPASIRDLMRDFASTWYGKVVLIAMSSAATGSLAVQEGVGPQLASIAFAMPGIFEGKGFTQAWVEGFVYRVKETAKILVSLVSKDAATWVARGVDKATTPILEALQPALDDLGDDLNAKLAKAEKDLGEYLGKQVQIALEKLAQNFPSDQIASWTAEHLAAQTGVREDMAAEALSLWNKQGVPDSSLYDPASGRLYTELATARNRAAVYTTLEEALAQSQGGYSQGSLAQADIWRSAVYRPLSELSQTPENLAIREIPIAADAPFVPPPPAWWSAPWTQAAEAGIALALLGVSAFGVARFAKRYR